MCKLFPWHNLAVVVGVRIKSVEVGDRAIEIALEPVGFAVLESRDNQVFAVDQY